MTAVAPTRRGWTVVLVPPHPTGKMRTLRIAPAFVTTTGLVAALLVLGVGTWTTVTTTQARTTAGALADARGMILQLTDSLRRLHENGAATSTVAPEAPVAPAASNAAASAAPAPRRTSSIAPPVAARRVATVRDETPSSLRSEGIILPVIGEITSRFSRARRHPLLRIVRPHYGVDVSAPAGTPISAPAAGRVRSVGRHFGAGLVVEIDHGEGVVSRYLHCRSATVHEGETVYAGMTIATVGSSGLATGPHLHFEVLIRDHPVDPLHYHFAQRDSLRVTAPSAAAMPAAVTPTPTTLVPAPALPAGHVGVASSGGGGEQR